MGRHKATFDGPFMPLDTSLGFPSFAGSFLEAFHEFSCFSLCMQLMLGAHRHSRVSLKHHLRSPSIRERDVFGQNIGKKCRLENLFRYCIAPPSRFLHAKIKRSKLRFSFAPTACPCQPLSLAVFHLDNILPLKYALKRLSRHTQGEGQGEICHGWLNEG
jgi:hypothetical protein